MTSKAHRTGATLLVLCLGLGAVTAGCSEGGDDDAGAPEPGVTPTAVGDPPLVRLLDPGTEPRRTMLLAPDEGARTSSTLVLDQEVDNDGRVTDTPAITFPFDTEVTGTDGEQITTTQTYGRVTVEPTTTRSAQLTEALAPVAGTTGTVTQDPDGSVVDSSLDLAGDAPAATTLNEVRVQVQALSPVFPAEEVGAGASWTVTSVLDVDAATVDQTATYTLQSVDGDDYVVGVTVTREYRTGPVEGVEVIQGGGTVSGRLEGSLDGVLPRAARADATTAVTYLVDGTATEVTTTIAARLTSG